MADVLHVAREVTKKLIVLKIVAEADNADAQVQVILWLDQPQLVQELHQEEDIIAQDQVEEVAQIVEETIETEAYREEEHKEMNENETNVDV